MICFNCCVAEQPQPVSIPELYPFDCIRVCSLVAFLIYTSLVNFNTEKRCHKSMLWYNATTCNITEFSRFDCGFFD